MSHMRESAYGKNKLLNLCTKSCPFCILNFILNGFLAVGKWVQATLFKAVQAMLFKAVRDLLSRKQDNVQL